jgi:RNA polymerase sigma factor (sigma-70 family)
MQIPQSNVSVIRPDLNSSIAPFRPRRTIQTANMRAVEFDVLMTAHQPGVLRAARRLLRHEEDAQDAVQEVFLRLLVGRSNVQGDPGAWLYRVTVNFCNDYYRQRRPTLELLVQTADPAADPECLLRFRERERLFREGLGVLTKRERDAVVLREIKELSAAEVGAILDIKEVTVRRHIQTARRKLADYVRTRMHAKGTGVVTFATI